MKHIFTLVLLISCTLMGGLLYAQDTETHLLDDEAHNQTYNVGAQLASFGIWDDGGNDGNYTFPQDRWMSVRDTLCNNTTNYYCISFTDFDVASTDTLFIYDGPDINSRLIIKSNNSYHPLNNKTIYAGPNNAQRILTIRLKAAANSKSGAGFTAQTGCRPICEYVVPRMESKFYRTKDSVVYDSAYIDWVYVKDSVGDTTDYFLGANLCLGDGLILNAHISWDSVYGSGWYAPNDTNITFHWVLGDGHVIDTVGGTRMYIYYNELDCYDISVSTIDRMGCTSTTSFSVKARLAQNPIKTIYDLESICNIDSLLVNVGYSGDNSTITLRAISFEKIESKINEIRTFIPDGPNCPGLDQCYNAPVVFNEFPTGKKIASKDEICSICVNMEHSFMGDYRISIVCPSLQKATIKWGSSQDTQRPADAPNGSWGGGGTYNGIPYGGLNDFGWDGSGSGVGDSLQNPFGIGYDYCFSRNGDYTLVDGNPADITDNLAHFLGSEGNDEAYDTVMHVIPAHFARGGQTCGQVSGNTRKHSDHMNKTDYYKPYSDFGELIGCPLNGEWNIEVCDLWAADNGWVFNWSLDLCGISNGSGCEYQVGIDSVTWLPDSVQGDWLTGKYRGLMVEKRDSVTSYIISPDTAGNFRVMVSVYDEFGCVWDTNANISTIWTPTPNLGNDTVLCSVESTILDASDEHTRSQHYTYAWEPYGQESETIETETYTGKEVTYIVEATNFSLGKRCTGRDTIKVDTKLQPIPNFDPGVYPLEGCEPFVIHIDNSSIDGDKYEWIFGDGATSEEKDPTHTYLAGTYDLKYYVTSADGCIDSLIYPDLITVFPNPVAKFDWEPVYPSVMHPSVSLNNYTTPDVETNEYFWQFQYDVNRDYSFHTVTDKNPTFEWYSEDGEKISGSYIVRLIARTTNYGPSGNKTQCIDTTENSILLVNDFLQFPNVVTPNGDGINDRFEIINLVDGFGYPINRLEIFNKWGSRVFLKENISRDEDFWDPNDGNSPSGTYYFHFTGKGYNGVVERNGVIEVVR